MIKQLPKEIFETISSNKFLLNYLFNLERGRNATTRSWLYETEPIEKVKKNWLSILKSLENGNAFEKNVYQFDISQLEKWGPQGQVAPLNQLLDSIVMPSFEPNSPSAGYDKTFSGARWHEAIHDIQAQMCVDVLHGRVKVLRPRDYRHVLDDMRARDTLESNSGYPDFRRRNFSDVKQHAITAAQNGEWLNYPAILLFRNYHLKTRMVWMFPLAVNLVEGSFFQPLMDILVKSRDKRFSPWRGFDEVREQITRLYDSGEILLATDFSETDAHFRLAHGRQVFEVLADFFQSAYTQALAQSIQYMFRIPLIISTEDYIVGEHGLASGSNWTNFLETVFDLIFGEYVAIKTKDRIHLEYAIGDDILWRAKRLKTGDDRLMAKLSRKVGQVTKQEKLSFDTDKVKTLQRLFQRGYRRPDGLLRGVYSTVRALNSSLMPEKFHKPKLWSSDMFCARQFMILENCVDHPLFEEFVRFVCKGQRDLIPFAKKSSAELERIRRETKLIPGLNPTYNQERRDSALSSFKAIEIARSL